MAEHGAALEVKSAWMPLLPPTTPSGSSARAPDDLHPAYRPDIDGLRAIAVSAVVIFHVWRDAMPVGFMGVDLFFVLSGFLITKILWRESIADRFSIARFYERRIRRIMPALLVMLLATTVGACFVLLPVDLVGYGKSVVATIFFVANIYFWRDTNYFSRTAEEKPLLHMWSLGVEEQFYIFFPFVIFLLAKFWRRGAVAAVLVLTIASLALNVLAVRAGLTFPAFYLLPTRAWEMGAGAFLALLATPNRPPLSRPLIIAIGVAGLVMVIVGIAHRLSALSDIPNALLVVFGTCMVIWSGQFGIAGVGRLLALRPVVFVGLVSYSLYLWHWPIIVFAKYYLVREVNLIEGSLLIAIMFACAVISWRYVERPVRDKTFRVPTLLVWTGAGAAINVGTALVLIAWQGLPWRLNESAARINAAVGTTFRCAVSDHVVVGFSRGCKLNLPSGDPAEAKVVLMGNSHALMYAPVVGSILKEKGLTGLLVMANRCIPSATINFNENCRRLAERYIEDVVRLPAKVVVVSLNWSPETDGFVDQYGKLFAGTKEQALTAGVSDTIARLEKAGKVVVLVGPIAVPGWDVASVVSRSLAFGRPLEHPDHISVADFRNRYAGVFEHFGGDPSLTLVRPDKIQCDDAHCHYVRDGRSLFADSNHIAQAELPLFKAALADGISVAVRWADSGR
ncbi:acyltransferase family protein [Xanthobacter autotrophicus DSM 597]|uniref:acyltransferase family protein n=1 Tax=Xanthobacter wiegelii TaxID=3119913 RepID=UPI003727516D